jgi:hypothetical protein
VLRSRLRWLARLALGSLGGAALAVVLAGCFSAPPQIVSLEPNRGSTSVPADAPVQVVFDRPVAHDSVASRFSVSPSIPGCDFRAVFSAPSTAPCWIQWLPGQPGFELLHEGAVFAPATRYTFTLAGGFQDPQGDSNDLDHHWDLTTAAAPLVASTTPAPRAADVPVDAPLAVSFNTPMDAPSTAAAISLDPAVPGTRVVRNSADHSRFVILPGELLDPGVSYTIRVAATARGEDQQAIFAAAAVRFTTGSRLLGAHAVVLAGVPGEGSTEVLLPALGPAALGEPLAAPMVLTAPRCEVAPACGRVPLGAPLLTYAAAAVAPGGEHIAVVVDDSREAVAAHLEVIDVVDDSVAADIPGGAEPSWSPDGTQLALASPAGVVVFDVRAGTVSTAAAATAVIAPPLWSTNSTLVLSTAARPGTPGPVALVNRSLDARYDLPGSPAASTAAAVSPGGTRIALATAGGSVLVVPAAGATGGTQRLTGQLTPIGFAGEGILLAINESADPAQLVRISVVGGDSTAVSLSGASPDLQTVRVAPDGRRLVCLAVDASGVLQAYVADSDGSGEGAMTRFLPGGLQAQAADFSV